jgi:hypothetical protein
MSLNLYEQAQNKSEMIFFVELLAAKVSMTEQQKTQLSQLMLSFASQYEITLLNLLPTEKDQLLDLMQTALNDAAVVLPLDSLNEWKTGLVNALPRSHSLRALHAKVSGIAYDLEHSGRIPPYKWGIDLDIEHTFGADLTVDPANISSAGMYILKPISVTESREAIKGLVERATAAALENNINGAISLQIIINCGNSHWRLATIDIVNKQVVAGKIWDSLGEHSAFSTSEAFKNIQAIVPQPLTVEFADVQTNSHSCMDYCIQKVYANKGVKNAITAANSADHLRMAIIDKIAENQFGREVANAIDYASLPNAGVVAKRRDTVDHRNLDAYLRSQTKAQIEFDAVFAQELDNLYKVDTKSNDKLLERKALEVAMSKFTFFSGKTAAEKGDGPAADLPSSHGEPVAKSTLVH